MDMSLSRLREIVKDREIGVLQSLGLQRIGLNLEIKQQVILYHSYWGTVTNTHTNTYVCITTLYFI